jgi:hypothetical protein
MNTYAQPIVRPDGPTRSIEAGHFYAAAFAEGIDAMANRFGIVKHFVDITRRPEDSVVFLFDDYHNRPNAKITPADIISQIQESSGKAGLQIDYVGREAACARLSGHVLNLLKTTGYICETPEQGWLLDDTHPSESPQAMAPEPTTPRRNATRRLDIEIYDRPKPNAVSWACPYLASIWQGLRLGVLHDPAFEQPYILDDDIPDWKTWHETPPLIQLNPEAAPFAAAETLSILPSGFMEVEAAVEKILGRLGTALQEAPGLDMRNDRVFLNNI